MMKISLLNVNACARETREIHLKIIRENFKGKKNLRLVSLDFNL